MILQILSLLTILLVSASLGAFLLVAWAAKTISNEDRLNRWVRSLRDS